MSVRKFYISDWHYGHANVIAFDNRPFTNVDEMNAELIDRWNKAVNPGDTVYCLGDMFWKTKEGTDVIRRLNGQKFLVKGNHDRCKDAEFNREFVKIAEYMEVVDGEHNIILCHYPIPFFKKNYYGYVHLYGHVHNSFEENMTRHHKYLMEELYGRQCRMYNVGAMMPYMDYTPRTIEEILSANEKGCE